MKIRYFLGIVLLVFIFSVGCDTDSKIARPPNPSELNFKNVQAAHEIPSKVQFIFSLRDKEDHAVIIPQAQFDEDVEVKILEDGQQIDYAESHGFIHTAQNFDMSVVLVLDFTESMANAENGIETMINGAKSLINNMGETHRIAVIEFHDNDPSDNYSLLQEFTTNKSAAVAAIEDFVDQGAYNGFSVCWDAVSMGIQQFPAESDPNSIGALIFLSDGFDNSSSATPAQVIQNAKDRNIRIFNIGVGGIEPARESTLQNISNQTGGNYYGAEQIEFLEEKFENIMDDLGGNYKISYITPKQVEFTVDISLTYNGNTTYPHINQRVDGDSIAGNHKLGLISFTESSVTGGSAEFFIRAEHVPRDITTFRFRFDTGKSVDVDLVPGYDGGLLGSWTTPVMDNENFFISTGNELEFGDFGNLFKVTIDNITEFGLEIPFTMDNSVYEYGVYFYGGDEDEIDGDGNWNTVIPIGVTSYAEDFEDGAMPAGWLTGDSAWFIVTDTVYQGGYSVRSGDISDNEESYLEKTFRIPEDTLVNVSFARKVSSESNDYLRFYIDGQLISNWSGERDWRDVEYDYRPDGTGGELVLRWVFEKDEVQSSGEDCAWIDDIHVSW
ncbi:MAG: VWA domain-containing protein [candidate division Zixibacteria bacterium]|nr:VWA domain-containing protein [candidate division Zixibacteria bacterium]